MPASLAFVFDEPLVHALACASILALFARDRRMLGTAVVLLLNWALCTMFVEQTARPGNVDDLYPWTAFLVFDYVAALAVLLFVGRGKITLWQVAVALIYGAMIVCHAARAKLDTPGAIYHGWYFLRYAAWAQAAVVIAWGAYDCAFLAGRVSRGSPRIRALLGSDCLAHGGSRRAP